LTKCVVAKFEEILLVYGVLPTTAHTRFAQMHQKKKLMNELVFSMNEIIVTMYVAMPFFSKHL
jgi:hypothetical protein